MDEAEPAGPYKSPKNDPTPVPKKKSRFKIAAAIVLVLALASLNGTIKDLQEPAAPGERNASYVAGMLSANLLLFAISGALFWKGHSRRVDEG